MKISHLLRYSWRLGFALLTCAVMMTHAQAAQTYSITNLGSLSSQYPQSAAIGLNATGTVVGYAYPSNGYFQGFLWKNGVMTNLGHLDDPIYLFPNTLNSLALGVNGSDQVVGWSDYASFANGTPNQRAVLWQNGVITDLHVLLGSYLPSYLSSSANAINTSGQIVGVAWNSCCGAGGGDRAILWQNGVITDLGGLGGTASAAYAISDAGQVVGKSYTANNAATHAFLWQNGVMTDLGALGAGTFSVGAAINASGQVVGASTFAAPGDLQDRHAFLYSNGTMIDLGVPAPNAVESFANGINKGGTIIGGSGGRAYVYSAGVWTDLNTLIPANTGWTLSSPQAINDAGQIVGIGTLGGVRYGYLLTPTSPGVDLALTLAATPNPATQGSVLTYTATVTNGGSLSATGVALIDVLPSGVNFVSAVAGQGSCSGTATVTCALGTLASGASVSVQIAVTPTVTGTLTNNISVSSSEVDTNTGNNSASISVPVNAPGADLSITMTDSPDPVKKLATLTYSIGVKNNGPAATTGVMLTDTLPSNVNYISATPSQGSCSGTTTLTCSLGSMASGANLSVTIMVRAKTVGTFSNSASVSSAVADPNTANNSAAVSTQIVR